MKRYLVIAMLAVALFAFAGTAYATVFTVSPGQTIQAAVTAAQDGDTIQVAAGTYTEVGQIVINKNLSIIGAGMGKTTIKPAGNTGGSDDSRGWFLVTPAGKLSLTGVTLDGAGKDINRAILSRGVGTHISNCEFKNISYPGYNGIGVVFYNYGVITGCEFSNMGRIGVFVFGSTDTRSEVRYCTYVGKGNVDRLDYGVEVGGGAKCDIIGCTIMNCTGVASVDGSTSAGILLTTYYAEGTNANVKGCTIEGCTAGIAVGYDNNDKTFANIYNNNIVGNVVGITSSSPLTTINANNNWWGGAVSVFGNVTATSVRKVAVPMRKTLTVAPGTATTVASDRYMGTGAWKAVPGSKVEKAFVPTSLFGHSIKVSDIRNISFATKNTMGSLVVDWYTTIYTMPYTGGDASWYGQRLIGEPMYSRYLEVDPGLGKWSVWSSAVDATKNQLVFHDSNHAAAGFSTAPTLDEIVRAGQFNWAGYPGATGPTSINYGDQDVKYIYLSTGTAWADQFNGMIDALKIELWSGESVTVDLESDSVSDALWVDVDPATQYVKTGDDVFAYLNMSNTSTPVSGYEAFLGYGNILNAGTATQTSNPFDLSFFKTFGSGMSDLSACLNFNVMPPKQSVTEAANLATLQFSAGTTDGTTNVFFRANTDTEVSTFGDATGELLTKLLPSQTIVIDNVDPTITAPANVTGIPAELGQSYATGIKLGFPTVADALSGVASVTNNAPTQFLIGNTTVTWTVTDKSGNQATATQIVTVVDTQDPKFTSFPANVTLELPNKDTEPSSTGTPVASDNSGTVTVTYHDAGTDGPGGTFTIIRTWTATDPSNRSVSANQTIAVRDTTAPEVTKGSIAAYYKSKDTAESAALAATTALDNSGLPPTWTVQTTIQTGCKATIKVIATDACGNFSSVVYYTYIDGVAPVVTPLPNVTANADAGKLNAIVNPALFGASATDNCSPAYSDDFEAASWTSGDATWVPYNSNISVGTIAGISAKSGAYGVINSVGVAVGSTGIFSRLGGYTSSFGNGFTTSQDVYIDLSNPKVTAKTYGFDLDCANASPTLGYGRDFVFHVSAVNSTGQVLVSASNGSTNTAPTDLSADNHSEITASGWYTFKWNFRNAGGVMAVDLTLFNSAGTAVFSQTLSEPSDLIGTVVGGNRYMWFNFVSADQLAIDNTSLVPAATTLPVTWSRSDGKTTLTDPYPIGTTTITWTATDAAGNTGTKTQTVTVANQYDVSVTVQLEGVSAPSVTRMISFEFGGDGTGSNTYKPTPVAVTFVNGIGTANLTIPGSINWTKVTAKDEQHTLRSLVNLSKTGQYSSKYTASFTGADNLIGGDLTNDNLIDIRDFGVFAGQYGTHPALNTVWSVRNADITCDGNVDGFDFSYFTNPGHFLAVGDPAITGAVAAGAKSSMSIKDMAASIGYDAASKADMNHDGVINNTDVQLFVQSLNAKRGR